MQERIKEGANKEVIDLPPPEDEPAEPPNMPDEGTTPEATEPAEKKEESPSSPSARFLDFIEEHKLDPTKARKLAATIRKLKDVRNLGNEDFEMVLNNSGAFLVSYRQQYGGDQPTFDERAGF